LTILLSFYVDHTFL